MAGYKQPDVEIGVKNLIPINERPPEEQAAIRKKAASDSFW